MKFKRKIVLIGISFILSLSACSNQTEKTKEVDTENLTVTVEPSVSEPTITEPTATQAPPQVPSPVVTEEPTKIEEPVKPEITVEYPESKAFTGKIYLYGEQHADQQCYDEELKAWKDYYDNKNMRHMFIELSRHTAGLLNLWMQEDNDDYLMAIYNDFGDVPDHNPIWLEFYRTIKTECPETIFHGIDLGFDYEKTAPRYLKYLEDNGMKDSIEYAIVLEEIELAKYYDLTGDHVFREENMLKNFVRELEQLGDQDVMDICGYFHSLPNSKLFEEDIDCMGASLKKLYGDQIEFFDIVNMNKVKEPISSVKININGKEYTASYYGEDEQKLKYYEIEDAYEDLKDVNRTDEQMWYLWYPMMVYPGKVYMIENPFKTGAAQKQIYIADENESEGIVITYMINVDITE